MSVHTLNDLMPAPEKIFDAALKEPQFVVRNGHLFVISRADSSQISDEVNLTDAQLAELNDELEKLGRRGSKVIDQMRA